MLLQLCHVIVSISCLSLVLGNSVLEQKLRIRRDTRNIPTDMFKPIGGQTKAEPSREDDSSKSFLERTTAETHAETGPFDNRNSNDSFYENEQFPPTYPEPNNGRFNTNDGFRGFPPGISRGPIPWPSNFDNIQSNGVYAGPTNSRQGFRIPPPRSGSGFIRSSSDSGEWPPSGRFIGPDHSTIIRNGGQFGGSRPLNSGTFPLMSSNFGFSGGPGPVGGVGGPSNNFYRSESYSYNSDGSGPPQIERNVYDSRQGFGVSSRNF